MQFDYGFDDQGRITQKQMDFNERSPSLHGEEFRWANFMFAEMFGGAAPAVVPSPAPEARKLS